MPLLVCFFLCSSLLPSLLLLLLFCFQGSFGDGGADGEPGDDGEGGLLGKPVNICTHIQTQHACKRSGELVILQTVCPSGVWNWSFPAVILPNRVCVSTTLWVKITGMFSHLPWRLNVLQFVLTVRDWLYEWVCFPYWQGLAGSDGVPGTPGTPGNKGLTGKPVSLLIWDV